MKRHHRLIVLAIGLNLLRDRRVQEQVLLGVITVVVLARLARQSEARALARLIAWVNEEPGPGHAAG